MNNRTARWIIGWSFLVPAAALCGPAVMASGHSATQHQPVADNRDQSPALEAEHPFLAENGTAMATMMAAMDVRPTGDVDRDFVAMMVPHHQGAIDMAIAVLRYGHNAQVRRLAQEIVVTQQQEIAALRLAVGEPLPESKASPTQVPGSADSGATNHMHSSEGNQ